MSISANAVIEVRPGGSDTNGGGFVTGSGGTDSSVQDAALVAVADAVANGTTTITSATAAFATTHVGNLIYLAGGSGTLAGTWRQVVSRTSATAIVVDATVAAGTGITLNLGGGLATSGAAGALKLLCAAGANVFIKYGASPYTNSSHTANVAGGIVDDSAGGAGDAAASWWVGYDTTRTRGNMDANRPRIVAFDSAAYSMLKLSGNYCKAKNLILDGGSFGSVTCWESSGSYGNGAIRCKAANFGVYGFNPGTGNDFGGFLACEATGGIVASTGGFRISAANGINSMSYCEAHDNACPGVVCDTQAAIIDCWIYKNTDGIASSLYSIAAHGCTIDQNTGHGVNLGSFIRASRIVNCSVTGHTGSGKHGIFANAVFDGVVVLNCGFQGNTTDYNATNLPNVFGSLAPSSSPYTNASTGDYSLNGTPGTGAVLRAAGFPAMSPRGATASYRDVGAAQHQDSGGTLPATTDVRNGVAVGGGTGSLVVPAASTVLIGTTFDNGTSGTVTLPVVGDVESGVTFGASLGSTGTFVVPTVGQVSSGVGYGASGTEFTGTASGLTLGQLNTALASGITVLAPSPESPTGTVVSATTTSVTISAGPGTTFVSTANAYSQSPARYLSFTSGANKGLVVTIASSSVGGGNLTLGFAATAGVVAATAGDTVEVD